MILTCSWCNLPLILHHSSHLLLLLFNSCQSFFNLTSLQQIGEKSLFNSCKKRPSTEIKSYCKTRSSDNTILQISSTLLHLLQNWPTDFRTKQLHRGQVTDPTWRVRFAARADRIWHIYRVAADSKSASSLRSLPQLLFNFQFNIIRKKCFQLFMVCAILETLNSSELQENFSDRISFIVTTVVCWS